MFATKMGAYMTPNIRFFFDNIWTLFDFWTDVRDAQFLAYEDSIRLLRIGFIACISTIATFTVVFSLIMPFISISLFRARQYRILDLLLKLPKKPVLDVLTTIEEEIELLALDEASLVTSKSVLGNTNAKWTFVLPGRYLLAIGFFYVLTAIKVRNNHLTLQISQSFTSLGLLCAATCRYDYCHSSYLRTLDFTQELVSYIESLHVVHHFLLAYRL
jgi:hypothetical protein